jgi:hypothetical protein
MTETTTAAPITVGLPSGLDPEKVRARKGALIAAGTDPLLAEKLAIDAELQQAARDAANTPPPEAAPTGKSKKKEAAE